MSTPNFSFYVTVGRGTETFAENEIKRKFLEQTETLAEFIQVRDGKILFQISDKTDSYLDKILNLKCVERAFVTITDYENDAKGKRDFLNKLMGTMSSAENYCGAKRVLEQLNLLMCERVISSDESQIASASNEPPPKIARLNDSVVNHFSGLHCTAPNCATSNQERMTENELDERKSCEKEHFKTFRMSVKCSGKSGKWINLRKLSKDLSWRVSRVSSWSVDLRKPDFEMCLHISDHRVTAGIPLTRKPLSRRPFILDPGLRAPVAWIMVQLAQIKTGDIILDPMCGKGTLVLEACSNLKDACYVGADIDLSQIQVAQQNVRSTGKEKCVDLLHANGLCLPFKPLSVSKVICDAPFNQKHFTSKRAEDFYDSFLQEMYRVLQRHGRLVLLISQDLSKMIVPLLQIPSQIQAAEDTISPSSQKSSNEDCSDLSLHAESNSSENSHISPKFLFQFESKHYMKLGETHGEIIVMTKL